jgi:hypothetical protein
LPSSVAGVSLTELTILIWPAVVLPMTRPFLSLPRPNKMQTSV